MESGKWTLEQMPEQRGRLALVTGANSGIGYEAALGLAQKGATVVLACRSEERGEAALARIRAELPGAEVSLMRLDLAELASVEAFAEAFAARHGRLDLLINNAGVMVPPLGRTAEGFELQFGVNHLGHFALTGRLLPLLLQTAGARVVVVSSQAHRVGRIDFDDLQWEERPYAAWRAYGQSKLANLLFAFELQRRLERSGKNSAGLMVTAAHPGWTATELQKHASLADNLGFLAMPAWKGALPTLRAATDPEASGGEYFGPAGPMQIWGYPRQVGTTARARDPELAARLWEVSEELTGVRYHSLAS